MGLTAEFICVRHDRHHYKCNCDIDHYLNISSSHVDDSYFIFFLIWIFFGFRVLFYESGSIQSPCYPAGSLISHHCSLSLTWDAVRLDTNNLGFVLGWSSQDERCIIYTRGVMVLKSAVMFFFSGC